MTHQLCILWLKVYVVRKYALSSANSTVFEKTGQLNRDSNYIFKIPETNFPCQKKSVH